MSETLVCPLKKHKNRKFRKCHSELSITVKICLYNVARIKSRASRANFRATFMLKSRAYLMSRKLCKIWPNSIISLQFTAILADFLEVLIVACTKCRASRADFCATFCTHDFLYARHIIRIRYEFLDYENIP